MRSEWSRFLGVGVSASFECGFTDTDGVSDSGAGGRVGARRLGSVLENGKQSRSVASNCGKFRASSAAPRPQRKFPSGVVPLGRLRGRLRKFPAC